MTKIGIVDNIKETKTTPKTQKNTNIFKEWDENVVEKDLQEQISNIIGGKYYKTIAKMSAIFQMDVKSFRSKCLENDKLANLLSIYNGVYVEDIMTKAINSGKINAQTEDYLKNEMQAYTGSGFEQHITFVEYDMSKEMEIEVDIEKDLTKKSKGLFNA